MERSTYNPEKEQYELVIADWYDVLKQIKERNGRVARMSELIRIRNKSPFEDKIWQQSRLFTQSSACYAKENFILLIREDSELLQLGNAEKAAEAHKKRKEYPITQEKYDSYLKKAEQEIKNVPEERSIFILPEKIAFSIHSQNYFDVLRFLAEDSREAEMYLVRLSTWGINQVRFRFRDKDKVDKQKTPFQDQVGVEGLFYSCGFFGGGRLLYEETPVLGIFERTSEVIQKNIGKTYALEQKTYTLEQIRNALNNARVPGLEDIIFKALEKE